MLWYHRRRRILDHTYAAGTQILQMTPHLPAGAVGAFLNLTGSQPTAQGWCAAGPTPVATGGYSNVNFSPGMVNTNHTTALFSTFGIGYIESHCHAGTMRRIIDIEGTFQP